MSYVWAFVGLAALIILHEAGHFAAAKAVGMRVERFSLFFGPSVWTHQVGETEYRIGTIPLGGYVRITGMTPDEEFETPEVEARAYYNQPAWKRIVVIAGGPAVNVLLAFVLVWVCYLQPQTVVDSQGNAIVTTRVASVAAGKPADGVLQVGDKVLKVDGVGGGANAVRAQIERHRCAGTPVAGCVATTAATLLIERDGHQRTVHIKPVYVATDGGYKLDEMVLGIDFTPLTATTSAGAAASQGASTLWWVTKRTFSTLAQIFKPKERTQLSSIVGVYTVTQQQIADGLANATYILAVISLSLALINLLPILPLDGGHIFWTIVSAIRGRKVSWQTMERASMVGIALVMCLFLIGLSNDITHIANGTL